MLWESLKQVEARRLKKIGNSRMAKASDVVRVLPKAVSDDVATLLVDSEETADNQGDGLDISNNAVPGDAPGQLAIGSLSLRLHQGHTRKLTTYL